MPPKKNPTFIVVAFPEFDNDMAKHLNERAAEGWRVAHVHVYASGKVRVLLQS